MSDRSYPMVDLSTLNNGKRRIDAALASVASFDLRSLVSVKRVGVMYHWRVGRIGGSLYVKKAPIKAKPGPWMKATKAEVAAYETRIPDARMALAVRRLNRA